MTRRNLLFTIPLALGAAAPARPQQSDADDPIRAAGGQVLPIAQNDERLEIVFRNSDQVTPEVMAAVAAQPNVAWLRLGGSSVSDEGLAEIAGLESLEKLNLEKTGVTDEGVRHLAGLTNLVYLNLYDTGIGDAALDALHGLENLEKLYVWQTEVTDAGVERLQKALPDLVIDRGWELPEEMQTDAGDGASEEKKPE